VNHDSSILVEGVVIYKAIAGHMCPRKNFHAQVFGYFGSEVPSRTLQTDSRVQTCKAILVQGGIRLSAHSAKAR
jgi:hypothetical protein